LVSGGNGVGKSTLLKILAGIWQPTFGNVYWGDASLETKDSHHIPEFLYIGHKIGLIPTLSPLQNLQWLAGIHDKNVISKARLLEALTAVGLDKMQDIPCVDLSRGQCQRVALARLWLQCATCWILDEPFTGLDEAGCLLVQARFLEHLQQKGIIIVASHRLFSLHPERQQDLVLRNESC